MLMFSSCIPLDRYLFIDCAEKMALRGCFSIIDFVKFVHWKQGKVFTLQKSRKRKNAGMFFIMHIHFLPSNIHSDARNIRKVKAACFRASADMRATVIDDRLVRFSHDYDELNQSKPIDAGSTALNPSPGPVATGADVVVPAMDMVDSGGSEVQSGNSLEQEHHTLLANDRNVSLDAPLTSTTLEGPHLGEIQIAVLCNLQDLAVKIRNTLSRDEQQRLYFPLNCLVRRICALFLGEADWTMFMQELCRCKSVNSSRFCGILQHVYRLFDGVTRTNNWMDCGSQLSQIDSMLAFRDIPYVAQYHQDVRSQRSTATAPAASIIDNHFKYQSNLRVLNLHLISRTLAMCIICGQICKLREDRSTDLARAQEWKHQCIMKQSVTCLGLVGLGPEWEQVTKQGDHKASPKQFVMEQISGTRTDGSSVTSTLRHVNCEGSTYYSSRVCAQCADLQHTEVIRSRLRYRSTSTSISHPACMDRTDPN